MGDGVAMPDVSVGGGRGGGVAGAGGVGASARVLDSARRRVGRRGFASALASALRVAGLPRPRRRPSASWRACAPPRKSVSYQPLPLSWKPAAETCLTSAARAARRAVDERRVAELLQRLELVAARRAAVFVDRHGVVRVACGAQKRLIRKENYTAIIRASAPSAAAVRRRRHRADGCRRRAMQSAVILTHATNADRRATGDERLLDLVDRWPPCWSAPSS